jgi:hypothetical protein
MFLVALPIPFSTASQLVFCMTDPRDAGYCGPVECDTELEAPWLCDSSWLTEGSGRVVGQDPDAPRRFRLFASAAACTDEGFRLIGPMPVVTFRWCAELGQLGKKRVRSQSVVRSA